MEGLRAAWKLSCSREDSAENMMAASQSRKNPKTSDGKYLADPLRNNGKTLEMTEYTDFVGRNSVMRILNLPEGGKMNTIEKIYTNYDGLLEEFSEEVIQNRYAVFMKRSKKFAKSLGIRENPDQ